MVKDLYRCGGIVLMVVCVLWTVGMGRDIGDFEQLTLEIATQDVDVLPMEPLAITITLSNSTARPIVGHQQIDPGVGFMKFYVGKTGEPFEQFHSSDRPNLTGIRTEDVLMPGFSESYSGYLFYAHPLNMDKEKRGQYLLESPGTYRVMVTFEDMESKKRIESNIVVVEASSPRGPDAAAYQFLKDLHSGEETYYGNFLLTDLGRPTTPRDNRILAKQQEFISKFPNSRYVRYLQYSLGLTYCRWDKDEDKRRGRTLLDKLMAHEDFFLAEDALLKLVEISSELGEAEQTRRYKETFLMRFPTRPRGRQFMEEIVGGFLDNGQFDLAREYALLALAEPNAIQLETELELAEVAITYINTPGAPSGQDWVQRRKVDVEVRLHAWKRLTEAVDPEWDPADLPLENVPPPRATGLPAGVAPGAIKDSKLRAEYMVAIEENRLKAERYKRQSRLREWSQKFPPMAEEYIIAAYSKPPFNLKELEGYLDKYIVDENTEGRILSAVTHNMER